MPAPRVRSFSEKVAVVTNGGEGVGRAVALQLALEGAYVIIHHDPNWPNASGALSEIQSLGTMVLSVATDLSTEDGITELFNFVRDAYGRLDLFAHVRSLSSLPEQNLTSRALWERELAANLSAPWFCGLAAASLMKGRPTAGIVNVAASSTSLNGSSVSLSPIISDGLSALTAPLGRETGVRVNSVISSSLKVPPTSGQTAKPDELARAALFLLSSEARAINGQTIYVG